MGHFGSSFASFEIIHILVFFSDVRYPRCHANNFNSILFGNRARLMVELGDSLFLVLFICVAFNIIILNYSAETQRSYQSDAGLRENISLLLAVCCYLTVERNVVRI